MNADIKESFEKTRVAGSIAAAALDEVAKIIKKVVGFKGDIVFDSSKPDGAPRKLIDISRLTKMGWNYSVNFEEGLKQTYDWYIKNNAQ